MRADYPNLDLSQLIINDIFPPTPGGDDTVSSEIVNSIHTVDQEVKETNDVVITQPALDGPDVVVVSSAKNPTTIKGLPAMNPATPDAPPS